MIEATGRTAPGRGALHRVREGARSARAGLAVATLAALALAGCQVSDLSKAAHLAPVPSGLERKIERMDMAVGSPIMLRIFKEESVLEVWKEDRTGRYRLLEEYEICAWSGKLGPKFKEGDRQAPEGFYTVTPGQMNPNSSYHLAFNIGFPNAYDRSHGRTGSHLMVHGDCSSRGCYAMEDAPVQEIYALAREAFAGGQRAFQLQAFPFRMTPQNMARHRESEHFAFWEMLKEGYDHFEVAGRPPKLNVCGKRYIFNARPDGGEFVPSAACPPYTVEPAVARLVAEKREKDLKARAEEILRLERQDDRRDRWEDREAAIAAFFNQSRAGTAEPSSVVAPEPGRAAAAAADPGRPVSIAGIPVPRPSPLGDPGVEERSGFSFPNPFRRRDAAPPAEETAAPVASTAGLAAPRAPEPVAEPAAPVEAATQPPPAAPDAGEDGGPGFLGSVANGARGIFRRAGDLLN